MATSGFTSDTSHPWSRPHTPPHTPRRRAKRPLSRNDSPASIHSAVQADETVSPAKKPTKRQLLNEVKVEELSESDAGYIADTEVVYPNELEEVESASDQGDSNIASEVEDIESALNDGITDQLSRLDCEDEGELQFEKQRQDKHFRRRADSRVFKRPHSLTINPELEMVDSDAMGDHDLPGSARRLRRRVRGPAGTQIVENEEAGSSPEAEVGSPTPANASRETISEEYEASATSLEAGKEEMDIDETPK